MSDENNKMTAEKAMRWLIEFGTDGVSTDVLLNTWANRELNWERCINEGLLEHTPRSLRLAQKAIDLIKGEVT